MKNSILPIGSIITVNGQDLMICAYFKPDAVFNNETYDYACCLYPSGMGETSILIKKESIQLVKFIGFQDNRFLEMKHIMENQ